MRCAQCTGPHSRPVRRGLCGSARQVLICAHPTLILPVELACLQRPVRRRAPGPHLCSPYPSLPLPTEQACPQRPVQRAVRQVHVRSLPTSPYPNPNITLSTELQPVPKQEQEPRQSRAPGTRTRCSGRTTASPTTSSRSAWTRRRARRSTCRRPTSRRAPQPCILLLVSLHPHVALMEACCPCMLWCAR